jgi:hypothetical protein
LNGNLGVVVDQLARGNVEGSRDAVDGREARISQAAFQEADLADV